MTEPIPLPAAPDVACLDFVNTRYWRGQAAPVETLAGFDDVLAWCAGAGAPAAAARPWAPPAEAHAAVLALREALYRLLSAAAAAEPAPVADVAALNAVLAEAPPRQRLTAAADAYAWTPADGASLAGLLSPALWSAADLLAGRRRAHLRRCANPECGWLFLDDSKSGNRRWCAMSACGNRAKARRHYARARGADRPAGVS